MKLVLKTPRSLSFEFENDSPYYKNEYEIYVNDKFYSKDNRNVFTIFNLEPNTVYKVMADNEVCEVKTKEETICLNFNSFNPAKDGKKDDTFKLQTAILALPKGGTLYIDEGTYFITSMLLKSDMNLYISKNAKLIGDPDRNNYPVLPGLVKNDNNEISYGSFEGSEIDTFTSMFTLLDCDNVNIISEGEVDCNATSGDWYTNHNLIRIAARPFGMYFNRATNINVVGLYIHNTPAWNIHPYFSSHLKFINMRIENPNMPTTDGIDPDCSDDVLILGNTFNVGDDCIAIKSGTFDLAKKYKKPSKDIVVRNCLMNEGHGGVVFGSESSAGILNVTVSNCIFKGTDRGLRIKTRRGRGKVGVVDNTTFKNILMDGVKTPFVVNMFYNMGPKGGHEEYVWTLEKQEVTELTPYVGQFIFENIKCLNVKLAAGVFMGLPEEPIKGLTFKNVSFSYDLNATPDYPVMIEHKEKMVRKGLVCLNLDHLILDNVKFDGNLGEIVEGDVKVETKL